MSHPSYELRAWSDAQAALHAAEVRLRGAGAAADRRELEAELQCARDDAARCLDGLVRSIERELTRMRSAALPQAGMPGASGAGA